MMQFETIEKTAFDLEIQINVENASLEAKQLKQVLKTLNPQSKAYKKAQQLLESEQSKAWDALASEIDQELESTMTQADQKISDVKKRLARLNKVLRQQAEQVVERQAVRTSGPKRPS
jgi:murein L,D-transpeptidase YcbB/YkuD